MRILIVIFDLTLFQSIFFVGGWIFFVKQLFRDYEVHHTLVQLIFSVTFALSCTMFELIIFEIIGYLDTRLVTQYLPKNILNQHEAQKLCVLTQQE